MSVDLVVRLQSFQQLDHYFAGRYKLRVSVAGRAGAAKPYFVPLAARGQLLDDCYETAPFAAPLHGRQPLGDVCAFRAVVGEGEQLRVAVDLLVSELDAEWTRRFPPDARGFSRIDGGALVVADPQAPLHRAAEVLLEGHLWSVVRLTLHAVLIGFRPALGPVPEAAALHQKRLRLLQGTFRRLSAELSALAGAAAECEQLEAWREKFITIEGPAVPGVAADALPASADELHRWSSAIYQLHMLLLEALQLAPAAPAAPPPASGEAERMMALFHARHEPADRLWEERPPCFSRPEVAASYRRAHGRLEELGQFRVWQVEGGPPGAVPVFFEERYAELLPAPARPAGARHLFVLVHGFQGSEFDMRAWKNFIVKCCPDTAFLISLSNQHEPRPADLAAMSANLAAELRRHLAAAYPAGVDRLSFLGHSLGGLVARGAVSLLPELRDRCFSYVSLGTPHLGVAQLPSLLVAAGLRLYKGLLAGRVLHELDLTDAAAPQEGALARLAAEPQLCWFRHVLLVGSEQDGYCPLASAHIRALGRPVERKMAQDALTGVAPTALVRLAVDFAPEGAGLDRVTGRTAHLALLQNTRLVQAALQRYAHFFA